MRSPAWPLEVAATAADGEGMTIRTDPGGLPHRRVAWWVVSAWVSLGLLVAGGLMAAAGVR